MTKIRISLLAAALASMALAGCTSSPAEPAGETGPGGEFDGEGSTKQWLDLIGPDTQAPGVLAESGEWAAGAIASCVLVVGGAEETRVCAGEPHVYDIAPLLEAGLRYEITGFLNYSEPLLFNPMGLGLSVEGGALSYDLEYSPTGISLTGTVTVFEAGVAQASVTRTIPQEANTYSLELSFRQISQPQRLTPVELQLDPSAVEMRVTDVRDDITIAVWDGSDQFVGQFVPERGTIVVPLADVLLGEGLVIGFSDYLGTSTRWMVKQDADAPMPVIRHVARSTELTSLGELTDDSPKQWDFTVDAVPFWLGLWWGGQSTEDIWFIDGMDVRITDPDGQLFAGGTVQNCAACINYRLLDEYASSGTVIPGTYTLSAQPDSSGDPAYASGVEVGYAVGTFQR